MKIFEDFQCGDPLDFFKGDRYPICLLMLNTPYDTLMAEVLQFCGAAAIA
ncbi:hypothetical protein [Chroococcidiopsis thermalis]|nr:hypothetical protein [Chroococcidiopsis thermalis]